MLRWDCFDTGMVQTGPPYQKVVKVAFDRLGVHVLRWLLTMAQVRQPGSDSGHGSQVQVLTSFRVVPSSLASHIHEDGPQHDMILVGVSF